MAAHDIIASSPTNQHPSVLMQRWLNIDITTGQHATRVANYFGQNLIHHTSNNWLYDSTRTLFNTVTNRFHTTRPCFARIVTTPHPLAGNVDDINPYIYALGATASNIPVLTKFIRSMSNVIEQTIPGNNNLSYYTKLKDNQTSLINHAYSIPALPTWHTAACQQPALENNQHPDAFMTDEVFAQNLHCNVCVADYTLSSLL